MDHPERPSRHKSHNKWKRIIEPAGDSDSSEWSSDSDGMQTSPLQYVCSLNSNTSAGGSRDQQTLNAVCNKLHDPVLSLNFDSTLDMKPSTSAQSGNSGWDYRSMSSRLKSLVTETGLGTSSGFTHLLHHDYAGHHDYGEREVNNERPNTDYSFCLSPSRDSQLPWKRKRKWLLNNRPDIPLLDCSIPVNAPTSSGSGSDDIAVPEPENAVNVIETPAEEDRWRILSNNRSILNSPPKRKLPDPTGESSDVYEAPGCSFSTQTQTAPHVVQSDSNTTEPVVANASPIPSYISSSDWYVQKKVMNRNKHVRFNDTPFYIESGNNNEPEDYSFSSRQPDPDIQVLSMAGPSNSTSRTNFPSSTRHSHSSPEVASTSEEAQGASLPVLSVVQTEDEGVEVIMVDDHPAEASNEVSTQTLETSQEQKEPQEQNKEEEGPTGAKQMKLEDELLNQGLIGLLECPVCMEYMGPPIHQCRRGHLVCSSCKPKLPSCPTCRCRFTESRNLAMEKVADKLHYPCKNAHVGCTTTLRLREKDEHEANCIFRSYRCIVVPPCEWKGQHREILPHVLQMHCNTLLQGCEHVLEMRLGDFTEQTSQNWIVTALGELFRVNLGAVRGGRVQVFACVLLLGPARRAPLFKYTITVGPAEGDEARRQVVFSRTTHCYVERCSTYYSAGDSFHLRTEAAQLFCTGPPNDRIMRVKVCIEKTET